MKRFVIASFLVLVGSTSAAMAADARFDLGLRFNAVGGNGEPTNDMLGIGLTGRFRLNDRWRIGVGLDHFDSFDFERPADLVGLRPATEVDAKATATVLSTWIERVYAREGKRLEWFWNAGVGGGLVDVDEASGPLVGGGSYTIVTDMDGELGFEEIVVGIGGGLRVGFGERSALEVALRLDQHIADWELLDVQSGATGRVDDYLIRGVTIGWIYRF